MELCWTHRPPLRFGVGAGCGPPRRSGFKMLSGGGLSVSQKPVAKVQVRDVRTRPVGQSMVSKREVNATWFHAGRAVMATYSRLPVADPNLCYYCGDPREAWDHHPPVALTNRVAVSQQCYTVPTCNDCNARILRARSFGSIRERCEYVLRALEGRCVEGEMTDRELSEFGPTLRAVLRAKRGEQRHLRVRLEFARERCSSDV